jgi:uncharacterized membrane protein
VYPHLVFLLQTYELTCLGEIGRWSVVLGVVSCGWARDGVLFDVFWGRGMSGFEGVLGWGVDFGRVVR